MRAQYPNSEPDMIMLLTAELVRRIDRTALPDNCELGCDHYPSKIMSFQAFSVFFA